MDDPVDDDESRRLPEMSAGEALPKRKIDANQHFTEPPPRYSEASLVKRMEELGIGRPSTYASILQVLRDRGYVRIDKKRLVPEDKGRWSPPSWRASSPATSNTISPPTWKSSSTASPTTRSPGESCCATSGATSPPRSATSRSCASRRSSTRSTRCWRRTSFRRAPTAAIRASARIAGPAGSRSSSASSAASSAARTIPSAATRASSPPATAPNGGPDGGMKKLGEDPETGLEVTLRSRPLRPLSAARRGGRRREAQARRRAQGGVAGRHRSRPRAGAAVAAARGRPASRDGKPIIAGIGRFGPYVQHGKTYANLDHGRGGA